MILSWIILATFINGLIALVGIFSFWINEKLLHKITFYLVAFSAGALLSGGLVHLYAESIEEIDINLATIILIIGFVVFYIAEKFLHWHHCHEEEEDCIHPVSYLILFGDGIHNFIDGLTIAASFFVDVRFGVITTVLIISHELPQEIGDFAILLHGGMNKAKALVYNFIAQLAAVLGGVVGFLVISVFDFRTLMLPFAAGGFLYIAASDLIPELKKESSKKKSIIIFFLFLAGIAFSILTKYFLGE